MMLAMLTDKNNLRWQVMTEKTGSVNIPGLFSHADIFLCVLLQFKKNKKNPVMPGGALLPPEGGILIPGVCS